MHVEVVVAYFKTLPWHWPLLPQAGEPVSAQALRFHIVESLFSRGGSNTVRFISTFFPADKARLVSGKRKERVIRVARED
jgi:hypothetical protein